MRQSKLSILQNRSIRILIFTGILSMAAWAGPSLGKAQPNSNRFANPAAPAQDQGAAPPSTPAPAAAKKVELPDGPGKPIATEYCQDCHRLTNLTSAHKSLDEWRDTVHLMMDRGARIPDEQVDALVQYLAKNFTPAAAATPSSAPAAAAPAEGQASTPAAPASSPAAQAPGASPKNKIELPDGDGKPIATEFCQDCHRLNNLTNARKSEDEWHDTVHLMMDRGARIPDDKVDTLVHYLAKNFGVKDSAPAPSGDSKPASPSN